MIEKLREELIKDIISELDKSVPAHLSDENNDVHNTITQIIVDTFDEYELYVKGSNRFNKYEDEQARLYTEDIKAQDRELNKKYK